VLWMNSRSVREVAQALVHDVRPATNMYLVALFDNPDEPKWLHRLYICFNAEDPCMFVARLAAAHARRAEAERALRHSLLIDSMPYGDLPQLKAEQINRMLHHALNNKALKTQMKFMDTSMLISEVNIEFARTQNLLAFEREASKQATSAAAGHVRDTLASHQALPLHEPYTLRSARAAPLCGTVPVPAYNFPESFTKFVFATLMTKTEVIDVWSKARSECSKTASKRLFHLQASGCMSIVDFLQVVSQSSCSPDSDCSPHSD
jgi:dynein heavy chain, axonemal